jgi:hypothetical protein
MAKKILKYPLLKIVVALFAVISLFGGYFAYSYYQEKHFSEDYSLMNQMYKEALYSFGGKSETVLPKILAFSDEWQRFTVEYRDHAPLQYANDALFSYDLDAISLLTEEARTFSIRGDAVSAQSSLEKIHDIWQGIFMRNDVRHLGVYMIDFHNSVESALEKANNDDLSGILVLCPQLKAKWQTVMNTEVDFTGDRLIDYRNLINEESVNLNKFCESAKDDDGLTVEYGNLMRKGFIRPYLMYG